MFKDVSSIHQAILGPLGITTSQLPPQLSSPCLQIGKLPEGGKGMVRRARGRRISIISVHTLQAALALSKNVIFLTQAVLPPGTPPYGGTRA
jgi:hypothetical protein